MPWSEKTEICPFACNSRQNGSLRGDITVTTPRVLFSAATQRGLRQLRRICRLPTYMAPTDMTTRSLKKAAAEFLVLAVLEDRSVTDMKSRSSSMCGRMEG